MTRYAAIRGWGVHVPSRILTNFDLERMVDTSDEWIVERTGISERRIAADEESTSTMSVRAARLALDRAELPADKLDLIVLGSASPDYLFPASACLVQDALGANKSGAFDLEAGCSSFIYGLSVASQFIASGMYDNILVVGAEALSRFVNWEDRRTCVLFGDGAGAVVLSASTRPTGVLSTVLGSVGSGGHLLSLPAGGSRQPASPQTLANGDHFIHMNGNEIFKFAVRIIGDGVEQAATKAGLGIDDIDLFIPHQANLRIIQAAAKRLGLPMEKVFVNVDKYGNTSSASIPIALYEAVEAGMVKDGDHLAFVAFGAGLTWASAIVKWGV